ETSQVGYSLFGIVLTVHFFDQIGDFIRCDAFFVQMDDKLFQCVVGTLIRRQSLLLKGTVAVSWNMQLKAAVFRFERPAVTSITGITRVNASLLIRFIGQKSRWFMS